MYDQQHRLSLYPFHIIIMAPCRRRGVLFLTCLVLFYARFVAGDDLKVAGYLPDYRFYIDVNQTALHLTDLYLFSINVDPSLGDKMLNSCCLSDDHLLKAKQAAAYKREISGRRLALWLTIGGGGRSDGLKALTKSNYNQLVNAIMDFSKEHGINGVDFDNESMRTTDDAHGE